jgi:hypothetical protein
MADEIEEVKGEDILVDDKGEILKEAPQVEEQEDDEHEDDRVAKSQEESGDEQGHADETAEEAEARRLRNRERRQENKQKRKDYIESLKRDIAARDEIMQRQEQRLAAVERRTHSSDLAAVDSEIKKTADAYEYFKGQHSLAVQEQNGAAATDATEKMFQAQKRFEQLQAIKKAAANQSQTPAPLDPRLKSNAESWLSKNSWYDPQARDEDSFIVKQLDDRLAQEGWNPTTEQYWQELDARVKKYLPHRAKSGYTNPQGDSRSRPRAPVAGSGRDSAGGSSQGAYRLSPDRVQAMKDAGIWDDPKARADMISRYKEQDRASARN